jgi:hypothetical protein
MNVLVQDYLKPLVNRLRWRRFWFSMTLAWGLLALFGFGLWLVNRSSETGNSAATQTGVLLALVVGLLVGFISIAWWHRRQFSADFRRATRLIEQKCPELNLRLATAVEQVPLNADGRLSFLQHEVIREAIYHGLRNPWNQLVPKWHIRGAVVLSIVSLLAVLASMLLVFMSWNPTQPLAAVAFEEALIPHGDYHCVVEPGNTEVEKGTSLLVEARFTDTAPPNVFLNLLTVTGATQRLSMTRSLNDPVFALRIPDITSPLQYHVEFESEQSPAYTVGVFEYPEVKRIDAELKYPDFAQTSTAFIKDVRRVAAVEGTVATFRLQTNKPLSHGELISQGHPPIPLEVEDVTQNLYTVSFPLVESQRYEVKIYDHENRVNRFPPRLIITVNSNQIPRIAVKIPGRDIAASPLEEVPLLAETWDDFGIEQAGLAWSINGESTSEVVLGSRLPAKTKTEHPFVLYLEDLSVDEDDLLTYYFWAEDLDSAGNLRRTMSDIYFIEVRPFDEIYRVGQPPTAQQMQNQSSGQGESEAGQAAGNLAETQKQIIAATWNLIRRESRLPVSAGFSEDTNLVAQSQAEARELAEGLAEQIQDLRSRSYLDQVLQNMDRAADLLQQAASAGDPQLLTSALTAEQAAYQNLLRLRAREHEMVQMNQQQMQNNQANQANNTPQMQQLEMDQDDNPYEEATTPTDPESAEARENRQVLNRLRELAQRQLDLNQQIQQLQTELEMASDEDRTEIENRLKRLQEEQQQILRDSDELRDRMQNEQNQQQMSDEARQLEEARENIQRSAEALENSQLSRAAAEGERAQRQLEELREEFQRRSANQFQEEMEQMRNAARELAERQQDLTRQMLNPETPRTETPTLRDDAPASDIGNELRQQVDRLNDLQRSMRETIERSEQTEPLLADQLYETFRQSQQEEPAEDLQSAARAWERGWQRDATRQADQARESIDNLRDGIDRASERVLGDDAERLRRAEQELERLQRDLASEIERNDPAAAELRDSGEAGDQAEVNPQLARSGNAAETEDRADGTGEPSSQPNGGRTAPESNDESNPNRLAGQGQPGETDTNQGEGTQDGERLADSPRGGNDARGDQRPNEPTSDRPTTNEPTTDRQRRSLTDDAGGEFNLDREWSGDPNRRMGRNTREVNPLSGEEFREWLDRLRDVEEMITDNELRQDAARIRNAAREFRRELRDRNSPPPTWDLARLRVMQPLEQLQNRVRQELLKKSVEKLAIPLDRDPVPAEYQKAVQRYYQELGIGE